MSFEEALKKLKSIVKNSHLDNQKHLDLTLVDINERGEYEKALMIVNHEVALGKITKDELLQLLGVL